MAHKTDRAIFAVTGTTFLTFLIAGQLGSIWGLYPNLFVATFLFGYYTRRLDEDTALLSSSAVFGLATTLIYLPMDWLLSREARLIFYLRPDFLANLTTPVGILLNWVVCATLAAYGYLRLTQVLRTRFAVDTETPKIGGTGTAILAAGLTAGGAAIGSTLIYAFGESQLWIWNAAQVDRIPEIAGVPVFVPVSFFFTFLLSPYFFGIAGGFPRAYPAAVAGIRCGIFLGALQFLSFLLFYAWR